MKKISIVVPTYNEEENVVPLSQAIVKEMGEKLSAYDYELLFIDNCSTDNTQRLLREICAGNPRIKSISDFLILRLILIRFVEEWEKGYRIVSGIKTASRENKLMRFFRTCYYKMIKKMSPVEQIEHFTGFGLYDRKFLEVLKSLDDPTPFLRGIVAELGFRRKEIPYEQQRRAAGKTHNNWASLYDAAMLSFTSYTKVGLRMATIIGFCCSAVSLLIALFYLVYKLIFWDRFVAGTIPILLAVCVLGSVQLFFIGLIGEYILSINRRVMKRPLVVEEERINFGEEKKEKEEG